MSEKQTVLVVLDKPRNNPYEVWLLIALLLASTLYLLGISEPASLRNTLPDGSRFFWNLQLMIGSSIALFGIFWNRSAASRTIQIAGQLWTGTGALVYAGVMFYHNGTKAAMAAIIVGSIAIAALSKALHLRRQVKAMIQKVEESNGANSDIVRDHGGDQSTAK